MLKVCVYAISKNEGKFVERWMDSMSEADLVVVADTGSTDDTVARLRERGARVYEEMIVPWRFDEARNRALSHLPLDADICVSIDMDEVFAPGWRKKLESAWVVGYHNRAQFTFAESHSPDGRITVQHLRQKIHARTGYRWIRPVHEMLACDGDAAWLRIPDPVLYHYPDLGKSRGHYLPLLELAAEEDARDSQIRFWLGREYMLYGHYDKAIDTLRRYLDIPSATWDEERSAAMRFIAKCMLARKQDAEAQRWLWRSLAECGRAREPYLAMAEFAYHRHHWSLAAMMAHEGLKITQSTGSYLVEASAWSESLYDYGAIACYWLGQYGKALTYAEEACRIKPDDDRLRNNLELTRKKLQAV